ncbi:Replicase polyprotein 1ab [Frankliniella fusca]|uniref:Replicase polyprotein 1ab n=1 Tax=Frankliniella fusca TaxID=407009 RepID=A0AAE1HIU6_9NEOP|nr:Replicase polyprotein 1ab [Frankliniella fusca]
MVHTVLRKPFYKKMDTTRDYTVKSTRNWSSFQLFSTPSTRTSMEASFRVHVFSRPVQWHRPFFMKTDPTRDYTVKNTRN